MDAHYTHHLDFDFLSAQVGESSSESWNARRLNLPDEEVLLASSSPKKRAGRKKFKETRHPVYRGVRTSHAGKWVCEAREPNKKTRIWLGTYPTADMAARAHDVAAIALRGRSACLNFADSVWRLPMPASKEAKDIQKAAAEAAEAFRPAELEKKGSKVSESVGAEAVGSENLFNMDEEEAMFGLGMPGLLADMAEGMLLPPPHCVANGYVEDDDMEVDADVSLWSYSV